MLNTSSRGWVQGSGFRVCNEQGPCTHAGDPGRSGSQPLMGLAGSLPEAGWHGAGVLGDGVLQHVTEDTTRLLVLQGRDKLQPLCSPCM